MREKASLNELVSNAAIRICVQSGGFVIDRASNGRGCTENRLRAMPSMSAEIAHMYLESASMEQSEQRPMALADCAVLMDTYCFGDADGPNRRRVAER